MSPPKQVSIWHHAIGILLSLVVLIAISFIVLREAIKLWELELQWQAVILASAPIACVILFLLMSRVPVGKKSYIAIIRGIGRLAALDRYLLFLGSIGGISLALHFILFLPVCSVRVSRDMSDEAWMRVSQKVGGGVVREGSSGNKQRILFLEDKRTALQRALQKERIAAQE
jgi:hypothetical protein